MAETVVEARLEKKIKELQSQIGMLTAQVRRIHNSTTHPTFKTLITRELDYIAGDLLGTTNQVIVTNGTNTVLQTSDTTLSLPQNIHTGATPTFAGLILTNNTNVLGNYYIRWRNPTDTTTYCYIISSAGGSILSSVNVPFQIQYGALGSLVGVSLSTTGDWVFNYEATDSDFSVKKQTAGNAYYYNAGTDSHLFSGNVGVGATATWGTNAVDVISSGIATAPTTSPANVSQLYVANRNGVDTKASWHIRNEDDTAGYPIGPLYGGMYSYENATAVAIDETNVYHAINTIASTGLTKGWTFKVGSTGPIASFATYEAGASTLVTDVGHGLLTGEIITIANSTNYNGKHVVTWVSNDTFKIPVAYVAEAGGPNWIRGSSLQANTGSAGVYHLVWSCTCSPAGANDNFKVEGNKNTTDLDNTAASMRLTVAADRRNMTGHGFVQIADGDYIWISTRNEDDADNITFRHFNVTIIKV